MNKAEWRTIRSHLNRLGRQAYDRLLDDERGPIGEPLMLHLEEQGLVRAGRGAGRTVYGIEIRGIPPAVIKVARGHDGLEQQHDEFQCIEALPGNALVPAIFDSGPGGQAGPWWTLVERVQPLSPQDFERDPTIDSQYEDLVESVTGVSWKKLNIQLLRLSAAQMRNHRESGDWDDFVEKAQRHLDPLDPDFARDLMEVIQVCGLDLSDIYQKPQQWGIGGDGELKILDLGIHIE